MDVSRSSSSCPRASCSLVQGPPALLSWTVSWLTAQSPAGCPYVFPLCQLACCILLFDLWQIKQWSYPAHFLYLLCAAEEVFPSFSTLAVTILFPATQIIAISLYNCCLCFCIAKHRWFGIFETLSRGNLMIQLNPLTQISFLRCQKRGEYQVDGLHRATFLWIIWKSEDNVIHRLVLLTVMLLSWIHMLHDNSFNCTFVGNS